MHGSFFLFWAVVFFVGSVFAALFQELIIAGFLIGIAKFFVGIGLIAMVIKVLFTLLGGAVNKKAS